MTWKQAFEAVKAIVQNVDGRQDGVDEATNAILAALAPALKLTPENDAVIR